ncbi:MAG: hypothetical protein ACTSV6_07100 [Candidatus Heimdallarchaeota archaeon]
MRKEPATPAEVAEEKLQTAKDVEMPRFSTLSNTDSREPNQFEEQNEVPL